MPTMELSAGPIEYGDTGGGGPVIVLLHGLLMDRTVWDPVLARLAAPDRVGGGAGRRVRCLTPTLPLGSHRTPMRPDADLSMHGMVGLVAEFLERLDLREVTLVGNDWGGAALLTVFGVDQRVARLVLVACEAFENYPPGVSGKVMAALWRVPGGSWLFMQSLRLRAVRRAPGGWGWMNKHPIDDAVVDGWFAPATHSSEIRRDMVRYGTSTPDRATLREWSRRQGDFTGPVLVLWATEDKLIPRDHGRRLVELYPDARLVEVEDSRTIMPQDRPDALADALFEFLARHDGAGHPKSVPPGAGSSTA